MKSSTTKKLLALVVLAAIVVGVAYLISGKDLIKKDDNVDENGHTKSPIEYKHVDLSKASTPEEKLPQGFPSFIPIENTDVVESYSGQNQDPPLTQYTLTYRSTRTVTQKFNEYLNYLTNNGYTFAEGGRDSRNGYLSATKENDTLSVVVSRLGDKTLVQLSYVDRQ